jgi:polyhydroxybutyrate depolymerase
LILAAFLAEAGWAQDRTVNLTHGGRSRSYLLHLPTGYDSTVALPLVLDFHGLSGTTSQQAGFSGFRAQSDKAKFLVAWPQGVGNSWNAGACCGTSQSEAVDDVAFAKAVVAHISSTRRVDARRVYATGFSNGGMFTNRLASQATDVFAAGAICAGALLSGITSPRPIAMIAIHGYSDEALPYDGGGRGGGTPAAFKSWSTFNNCQGEPAVETLSGRNKCESYATCQGGVEVALCSIEGTHAIFTNPSDFPVAERAWAFLSRFTLPQGTAVAPAPRRAAVRTFADPGSLPRARVPLPGGYLPDGREPAAAAPAGNGP